MVYLGVVPTALAFSTWAYALTRMDAGKLGVTTYLVPPLVIVLGWLLLDEVPPALALVGGAVCLAGVALSRRRSRGRGPRCRWRRRPVRPSDAGRSEVRARVDRGRQLAGHESAVPRCRATINRSQLPRSPGAHGSTPVARVRATQLLAVLRADLLGLPARPARSSRSGCARSMSSTWNVTFACSAARRIVPGCVRITTVRAVQGVVDRKDQRDSARR